MSDEPIIPDDEEVTPAPAGKAKTTRQSEKKWGVEVMALGFCMLPSLIFRAQARLGLNPTQLAVLLQLADFWWDSGRKPFPKKADLAERLRLRERQGQRHIADLETAGFVQRIERNLRSAWQNIERVRPVGPRGEAQGARAAVPRGGRRGQSSEEGGRQARLQTQEGEGGGRGGSRVIAETTAERASRP